MAGMSIVEQIQMRQGFCRRRARTDRVTTLCLRRGKEVYDLLAREVGHRRLGTRGRIERLRPQSAGPLQMLHQARIDCRCQLRQPARDPLPDQLVARLADQRRHLRMPRLVVSPHEVDQPGFARRSRAVELALSRRQSLRVLEPVLVAKQPQVNPAPVHLIQIHITRSPVRRRQIFEQEHLEEPPQQRIALNVILQRPPFRGEFLLNAADEDGRDHFRSSGAICMLSSDHRRSRPTTSPSGNTR